MSRFLAFTVLLCLPLAVSAHHGQSQFDRRGEMTLDGTVTRFEWANPHVYLYVETRDGAGNPVVWAVEGQPPTILKRQGWSPDSLAAGDRVVVSAFPPRDPDRTVALGRAVQTADDVRLAMGFDLAALSQSRAAASTEASGLSGTWVTVLEPAVAMNFLVGPVERADLPGQRQFPFSWSLTDKGAEAARNFEQDSMLPGADCVPYTAPFLMVLPDVKRIEIDDDVVRIRAEFEDVERLVDMSASSHDGVAASLQGHSFGRWEGDVLVVDTARFSDHNVGNAVGLPSGSRKHLVERFSLDAGGQSLTYGFELEDPEYLAAPVTGEVQWDYEPQATLTPVACDLANARRFIGG